MDPQALAALQNELGGILLGALFVYFGMAACAVAAIRRRGGVRIFVWLGIWSTIFGVLMMVHSRAVAAALPRGLQNALPGVDVALGYEIIVAATFAWLELAIGKMRAFLWGVIAAGQSIALAGIGFYVLTGSPGKLIFWNQVLATCSLSVLLVTVAVPKLCPRNLVLPHRGVMVGGTLVFAAEALYVNIARPLDLAYFPVLDSLGFACLLFSFAYVAIEKTAANERRLLAIERELEIARQVQRSILPTSPPEVRNARVAAVYEPMTEVAGDFYEFLPVDADRTGFLVADVSGHGVPAALIAAMIKTAVHAVAGCADDPGAVLRGLDRVLAGQLRGHFVSAAYLWLDTGAQRARYSAAGHPPLVRFRAGEMERIESNGLLFGVRPGSDYPVCELLLEAGDRLLLYTDGITDPENAKGDAFGDQRLEEVLRGNAGAGPRDFSDRLLDELRRWQPRAAAQQDDITLVVIDLL